MAVSIKKMMSNDSRIIKLYESSLEEYLKSYIISCEVFDSTSVKTEYDNMLLKRFYDEAKENANRLVLEDELVGITYDNLDIIEQTLNKNKLVKKM